MTQEVDAGVHLFTSEYWRQTPHWSTNDRGFNEKVKIILKLQIRQTAPMGQAGKVQIRWVVCKMGRKPAKRLHSESGDQSVSSSQESHRKTGEAPKECHDLWGMAEGDLSPGEEKPEGESHHIIPVTIPG